MERVADPAPSLALTTSSPPNWTPDAGETYLGRWPELLTVYERIILVFGNVDRWLSLAE
jgi:hypothetical protein